MKPHGIRTEENRCIDCTGGWSVRILFDSFIIRIRDPSFFRDVDPDQETIQFQGGGVHYFAGHPHDHFDADISRWVVDRGDRGHLFDWVEDVAVVADPEHEGILFMDHPQFHRVVPAVRMP